MHSSPFEQLGGEGKLREIISDFVERVFDDSMIGFFFAEADKERIKQKEYEFAANHLGGPVSYTGRPLEVAHGQHKIMGGHFMRRLQILRETLAEHGVSQPVVEHWLEQNESQRSKITASAGSECRDEPSAESEAAKAPPPEKKLPSIAEINAYLEQSAKRTKKRLPLAFAQEPAAPSGPTLPVAESGGQAGASSGKVRALPLAGETGKKS